MKQQLERKLQEVEGELALQRQVQKICLTSYVGRLDRICIPMLTDKKVYTIVQCFFSWILFTS